MMEIDDERWFGTDEVFSANFSEAKPLRGACPKPSSPDFDKLLRKKLCSVIIRVQWRHFIFISVCWMGDKEPPTSGRNEYSWGRD